MEWKRWLRLVMLLLLILVLYFAVPVKVASDSETLVRVLLSLLTLAALAVGIAWQLRLHLDDASRRVDGLIFSIVLVVVVFAHAFYVLDRSNPSEFAGLETRLDSLYFAVNTLTTVGTGDVHAAGQVARGLVIVQMVFNVVFVATTATLLSTRIRQKAETRAEKRRTQRELP
jgi:voltage-gated potassium channel